MDKLDQKKPGEIFLAAVAALKQWRDKISARLASDERFSTAALKQMLAKIRASDAFKPSGKISPEELKQKLNDGPIIINEENFH